MPAFPFILKLILVKGRESILFGAFFASSTDGATQHVTIGDVLLQLCEPWIIAYGNRIVCVAMSTSKL